MLSLIKKYEGNFEAQEAIRLIAYTNQSVFLTGKAGTGKSYLLNRITENTHKKYVILASTGVAALNVGGQTIHSFFRIEPRPYLPNDRYVADLDDEKIELLQKLDLIIIDEVSMVRCDLMQAVDLTLRKNLRIARPFAGKQLFLIGDLFQLPPVVDSKNLGEVDIVQNNYETPYFFSAKCFDTSFDIQIVELQKMYRQTDQAFINVLNAVRNKTVQQKHLSLINERYLPEYQPALDSFEITLTTTNAIAKTTNDNRLNILPGEVRNYEATATGEFLNELRYDSRLPAERLLGLKKDAQVMFIKNDKDKRWVNGSLGKIIALKDDSLRVKMDSNGSTHDVEASQWENVEYKWNKEKEEIEKIVTGTFGQFPIKLAWAVTIHKSQGQTFQNVVVDLGSGAFATGQTYVALSRCKTIQGIKLRKRVSNSDIKYDPRIGEYLDKKLNNGMEKTRYETIIAGLQEQLALLEPENERLKKAKADADKLAAEAKAQTAVVRAELNTRNGEVKALQEEVAGLKVVVSQLKGTQRTMQFWIFILILIVGVAGYLFYQKTQG